MRSRRLPILLLSLWPLAAACDSPAGRAPLSAAAESVARGPRLELVDPVHDWGQVEASADVVHVFELRNTGDELLQVRRARPS